MKGGKIEMSVALFAVALIVAFSAGATAVWTTEGITWSLPGDDSGSKADWLAAYGTWVIGLGAICFTLMSHLQSRSEFRDERRARVISAVLALGDAVCVKDSIDSYVGLPADQRVYGRLHICMNMLKEISKPTGISVDALKHMPFEASTLASRIDASLEAVKGLALAIEQVEGDPPSSREIIREEDLELCLHIAGIADELSNLCVEFKEIALRILGPERGN